MTVDEALKQEMKFRGWGWDPEGEQTLTALSTLAAEVRGLREELGKETKAACHWMEEANRDHNRLVKLTEVSEALLEWIDAVPPDTQLPVMPGIDRDWVDIVLAGEGAPHG